MKRLQIKSAIAALILMVAISSCKRDDFLNRYPQDRFTPLTYFQTETDLKLYANSFYDQLPGGWDYSSDNNSDNMAPQGVNGFLAGTYIVPASGGGWSAGDWAAIRQANYFLQRYTTAQVDNAIKEKYAGEVHFFRAWAYWNKVVRFGDVPLVLKDLTDTSTTALFGPRVNRDIVMNQVLADLNFAVANIPASSDAGRINKYAALALKSRICLWEGTYRKYHARGDEATFLQEAVNASAEIMNSGNYALYSTGNVARDYYNLFIQQDLSGNKEGILIQTFIRPIRTHSYTRIASENNTGASKAFVEDYLFMDGKPIGATSYNYDDATPAGEAANRDPRYVQTIATPGFVWQYDVGRTDSLKVVLPPIATSRNSTGYWLIKGRSSDQAMFLAVQTDIDAFIFRYAEVLLNYAEAQYELNGTLSQAELDKSINLIRARVGMPALTPNPVQDPHAKDYGYAVSSLLYEIRRERRIELIGEGFRFNDIIRWKAGKLVNDIKTILGMKLTDNLRAQYNYDVSKITVDADEYIILYKTFPNGRTWNDKLYLYPLPTDQINLAKYTQNVGW